jgi:hypothetical protein
MRAPPARPVAPCLPDRMDLIRLPPDILRIICADLDFHALLALRGTCKLLSQVVSTVPADLFVSDALFFRPEKPLNVRFLTVIFGIL